MRSPLDIQREIAGRRSSPDPKIAQATRRAAGVTQEWAAAELGVHRVTFARWEEGRVVPRGVNRQRWTELLRILREAG